MVRTITWRGFRFESDDGQEWRTVASPSGLVGGIGPDSWTNNCKAWVALGPNTVAFMQTGGTVEDALSALGVLMDRWIALHDWCRENRGRKQRHGE